MQVLALVLLGVLGSALGDLTADTYADPFTFFQHCRDKDQPCNDYRCYSKIHTLDLRQMDRLTCQSSSDCLESETRMLCVQYGGARGFCECPRHYAYNATSCQCQKAEMCTYEATPLASGPNSCHSGMQCFNERCSCTNLGDSLFEAQSRLCVKPRRRHHPDDLASTSSGTNTGLVVLLIILLCVLLVAIAIGIYFVTDRLTCNKGDYECDDPKGSASSDDRDTHVAAWDLPSLDYLSEEQTMKYLKRHQLSTEEHLDQEESRSPSQGSSSLPESERQPNNNGHHLNRGYISESDLQHV